MKLFKKHISNENSVQTYGACYCTCTCGCGCICAGPGNLKANTQYPTNDASMSSTFNNVHNATSMYA